MSCFPSLNYCEYNENVEVEAQWHERIVKFLADMQEYLLTSACPQLRNQSILHMENFREYVGLFLSRDPHEVDISYSARFKCMGTKHIVSVDCSPSSATKPIGSLTFRSPFGAFYFCRCKHGVLQGELCSREDSVMLAGGFPMGTSRRILLASLGPMSNTLKLVCKQCYTELTPGQINQRRRFFEVVYMSTMKKYLAQAFPFPAPTAASSAGEKRKRASDPRVANKRQVASFGRVENGLNEFGLFVPLAAGSAPIQHDEDVEEVYVPPSNTAPVVDLSEDAQEAEEGAAGAAGAGVIVCRAKLEE